jgi:hypothetical protein
MMSPSVTGHNDVIFKLKPKLHHVEHDLGNYIAEETQLQRY